MKTILTALILLAAANDVFADSFNSVSIQGQLASSTPIYDVKVHILSAGSVVGTASDIALIPDADGVFSTQTYITNPWVFETGTDYTMRLSTGTSPLTVISTFSITAVPFALTVRGDAQTGDQNIFGAYGNVGIGTSTPTYRLVVSSGGSNIMWVASDGVHATKFTGDGSGLTGLVGTGDNLGNHVAIMALNMDGHNITAAGDVTAARYQVSGSTVLAVLNGARSFAIGVDAGRVNSGQDNLFIGYQSGYSNTTGVWNTFAGVLSGDANTTGLANTFVGMSSGGDNTIGSSNAFYGFQSGQSNTGGYENTFLGYLAGDSNTTGSYNTFVGAYAGGTNTAGWANTYLGAGTIVANGTSNILVGDSASLSTGSAFKLNIGDAIYGNLMYQTLGIAIEEPAAALDVVSTGTTNGEMAQIWRNSTEVVQASIPSSLIDTFSKS